MLQLSHDLTRFKAHCEEKMRGLVASTVGAMEAQQRQEWKVAWLLLDPLHKADALCSSARTVVLKTWPRAPGPGEHFQSRR